jgi:hypothetical protein
MSLYQIWPGLNMWPFCGLFVGCPSADILPLLLGWSGLIAAGAACIRCLLCPLPVGRLLSRLAYPRCPHMAFNSLPVREGVLVGPGAVASWKCAATTCGHSCLHNESGRGGGRATVHL